ncbi:arsenical pump-driving ATPase [Shewanella putrefaciens]|uniref:Arsenical pump-driving ATPase n=1 Tax=Shewanella putrefaciens (strain CN-32 / ATCC BAA-453) TaxID=319224 RepID=A4YC51_SHEPC|nr:arsenical pump-driving ATPase [Shewanella putrefaciens]QGS48131.1 arsenical pump-driving ATPase [Shewanella putrefaciens]
MKFIKNPPAFLFFTGKGGVGKTSLSCATAINLADKGKRVLLVSTDPASNVGQVFGQTIGNQLTPIDSVAGLTALEIDPQAAAAQYRARIVDPVKGILPPDVVRSIEEQLSGACTTEIAAFDEFTGLLTDDSLQQDFDHIIFDTAPTGHTIRLLQLPGAWSSFIEANPEGASCLGPLAGLEKQAERYAQALIALADPDKTRLILVARPQQSTLIEVERTHQELRQVGLKNQYLVINGVLPQNAALDDPLANALYRREQAVLANLSPILAALPHETLPLQSMNMVGVAPLRQLLLPAQPNDLLNINEHEQSHQGSHPQVPTLDNLIGEIAKQDHGLIMLMGKGGVGKTTLAAAIAVRLAELGLDVHLTTSDPAAHLEHTLHGQLANLQVSRIDPVEVTTRYREQVLATKGKELDAQGKALLEEDLRSPCTEEIAVFQAFSRIIREAGKRFVVMDTAPTGHTLLLLDATGAYHREVAKRMGETTHYSTPMMQLQDKERTKVLLVTLPETTPVLEAANLQEDLRRAGIEPWAWLINNSLAVARTTSPLLKVRARHEVAQIDKVQRGLATRLALIPLQEEEPIGIERLSQLAK